MEKLRKPFEGVINIIRFNWHFYAFILIATFIIIIFNFLLSGIFLLYMNIALAVSIIVTVASLAVSYYVYDRSELYQLKWLDDLQLRTGAKVLNIHAGFDEIRRIIDKKIPFVELKVYDFYDPEKHTEVSIKRARLFHPPFPKTSSISTAHIPELTNSVDLCILFLAAHEIRNEMERIRFFKELDRILKRDGRVVVTEHLRDTPNFFAYNIGFFHFHSRRTWLKTFREAQLVVQDAYKITPFVSTFILAKHGI